jgi:hypothetical protein
VAWSEFRKTGLTHRDANFNGGYTLITPIGGDHTYLVDENGRIVHGWHAENFKPGYAQLLKNGHLLVRGQEMVETKVGAYQAAGKADILIEMDWDGNFIWRWEHPSFHHDMCRLQNGNTLVITWDLCDPEIAKQVKGGMAPEKEKLIKGNPEHMDFILGGLGVGGRPRDLSGYLSDTVYEITPSGDVVNAWHAWEHCDLEKDVMCAHEFPYEWTHGNSIKYCPEGKVLISYREISLVMMIKWPEGDVLWRWGGDHLISHPHDATLTPEGNVLVFDNGTHHPVTPHSRVIEVDMKSDKIVWQYVPHVVFSFFSGHVGGCERLPDGNTLICEGQSGRLFEVTKDSKVCWEWISPFVLPFKNVHCSMLFRAHRYYGDGPELSGKQMNADLYEELNRELGLIG